MGDVRHDGWVIDRALTRRIANAIARQARGDDGPPPPLTGDLVAICTDAKLRVVTYTGLNPRAALPVPESIERPAWIAANVDAMGALLDPIGARLTAGGAIGATAGKAAGALMSAEAGALTGYLSQRVLGQYEFAFADPDGPARLLFVAPNIARAAQRLDADPLQLLTWIAFHEVTHAVQFTAVPWLRPHLAGLLRELLATLDLKLDARSLMLRLPSIEDLRGRVDAFRQDGIVGALGGSAQRDLLERVQAVMGVVEGHAEHVMDVVGAQALPSLADLRSALDRRRRERPPLLALLERLIGLEAKLRQYEDGKRFCDAVVAAAGAPALHRVFDGPQQLPSVAELRDPEAWMRRTGLHALAS